MLGEHHRLQNRLQRCRRKDRIRMQVVEKYGAPGVTRTRDPLLRSRLSTFIKTCRSERKAEENQQVVIDGDELLTPFSSPLSTRFAAIYHN